MTFDREKYRAALVAQIWSDDLRAELVDRVVDLVANGDALGAEVDDEIRRANYAVNLYKETDGARGIKAHWVAFTAFCKRKYSATGRVWTVPESKLEPQPTRENVATQGETVIFRSPEGYSLSLKTEILTPQQAQAATDYFAKCGKKYSYREARQIIQDVANGLPFPKIDDPAPNGRISKESWAALAAKLDKIGRLPW